MRSAGRNLEILTGDNSFTIAQLGCKFSSSCRFTFTIEKTAHFDPSIVLQNVAWSRENILDERGGNYPQRNVAIDAAKSEVVDLTAKRWYVLAFGRVDFNGDHIVATPVDMRS